MYILCCLLSLLLYATTQTMDHQLERWQRQEFWDLADDDNLHNEDIIMAEQAALTDAKYQRYLDENPLFLPLDRRRCLAAIVGAGIFLPPVITSQPALQSQLMSLAPELYIVGAGITTLWTIYELKQLIELINSNNDGSDSEDEIFDELY